MQHALALHTCTSQPASQWWLLAALQMRPDPQPGVQAECERVVCSSVRPCSLPFCRPGLVSLPGWACPVPVGWVRGRAFRL